MLSSFTRIETYAFSIQVGKHIFENIKFNDLDMFSLMAISETVEDEYRLGFYNWTCPRSSGPFMKTFRRPKSPSTSSPNTISDIKGINFSVSLL